MKFFQIWKPFALGGLTIRNRIVMPAMHLNYADEGFVNETIIEFYRRRAQGQVGLIIVGGIDVEKRGRGAPMMISMEDDKFIPKLKLLTDVVHHEGAKIIAQLYHAGAYTFQKMAEEQAVSSSAVYSRFTHEVPRALTETEIIELEEKFVLATKRAIAAGFDGIEFLSSAGYLIDQFLSPVKNLRTDRYGGKTLQERLTFPLELIDKVKSAVGNQLILGCRLSGDDFVPNSNTYHEKITIAQAYASHGIQYFNVTGGWHETRVPQIPMDVPRGAYSYLAKEIRKTVHVPVFASNRINDPLVAERLLQDEYADAVCMGRALIADPDLPLKIKENHLEDLRKCIGCNQGCFDSVFQMQPVTCTVNPIVGLELKYSNPKLVPKRKTIVIVGSGPSALEAARISSSFGHKTILYEKDIRIGGQVNVAWVPPGRQELFNLIEYYQTQLAKLGVELHLGLAATPKMILSHNPDEILLGTGVKVKIPPIKGIDGSTGTSIGIADEALDGNFPIGHKVVIVGAAATGVETAIWAAKRGAMEPETARFLSFYEAMPIEEAMRRTYRGDREVFLIEILEKIATSVGKSTRWMFIQELQKLGVNVITTARITEFRGKTIIFQKDGQESRIDNVDSVILATGVESNRDLELSLQNEIQALQLSTPPKISLIGDARRVGTILDAISSGFKAGFRLGRIQ